MVMQPEDPPFRQVAVPSGEPFRPGAVVNLVPTKPDEELANDFRAELAPLLAQVAAVMTRARRQGIVINWGIGPDASGRDVIQNLTFAKYL